MLHWVDRCRATLFVLKEKHEIDLCGGLSHESFIWSHNLCWCFTKAGELVLVISVVVVVVVACRRFRLCLRCPVNFCDVRIGLARFSVTFGFGRAFRSVVVWCCLHDGLCSCARCPALAFS